MDIGQPQKITTVTPLREPVPQWQPQSVPEREPVAVPQEEPVAIPQKVGE